MNKNKIISDSEIILTIKGNNTQKILNNRTTSVGYGRVNQFNTKPSQILVNGKLIDYIDYYIYNMTSEINNIIIKFNQTLKIVI